ncbi:MAG TPA: N-6 DNA methylase [Lacunisphaera sp.]|nr:N-6 DNA methylase [Lacunisphaera sp.]
MKAPAPRTLAKILGELSHSHDARDVFRSFCRMAACALACQTRETEYLEEAKRYTHAELEGFAEALAALVVECEQHPFEDCIGPMHMELLGNRGQQHLGEFHTPPAVCKLIARVTMGDRYTAGTEPITLCEPACGAGAMILAAAEAVPPEHRRRLRVTAIDINATACDMTFINTTLWGIPCRVLHGNALTLEFWHAWSNVHHITPWLASALQVPAQGAPPDIHETTAITRRLQAGQLNLKLEEVA